MQQRRRTVGFLEGGKRKARGHSELQNVDGLKQANCEGEESRGSKSL